MGRKVLKSEMPQISLLLCLFHVLRTCKREITTEKMEITSAQRTTVLEVLQRITYSPSEEEYTTNYHDLLALEIPTVTEYFNKNWHSIRTQWVEGLKRQSFSLGERTTNRVESTFQKIKSVTSSSLPLQEFLKILLKMISTFRTERQHRALTVLAKVSRCTTEMNEDEAAYSLLLTPYAYKILQREQKGEERVTLTASENSFTCQSTEGELIVTDTTCSCTSYSSIGLPCKHIFAARKEHRIPLFDNSTVNKRWTGEDYRQKLQRTTTTNAQRFSTPRRILQTPNPARKSLQQVLQKKMENPQWKCEVCTRDLMLHDSISCDACLLWSHLPCLELNKAPRTKFWYCKEIIIM